MNDTMWNDIERKLKSGLTYREITQYTGVEEKYIKQIDDYIKERENGK
jgi:hypothetical protein